MPEVFMFLTSQDKFVIPLNMPGVMQAQHIPVNDSFETINTWNALIHPDPTVIEGGLVSINKGLIVKTQTTFLFTPRAQTVGFTDVSDLKSI